MTTEQLAGTYRRLEPEPGPTARPRPVIDDIQPLQGCDICGAIAWVLHSDPRARGLARCQLKQDYDGHERARPPAYLLWWTNAMTPPLAVHPFDPPPTPTTLGRLALRILRTSADQMAERLVEETCGAMSMWGKEERQFVYGVRCLPRLQPSELPWLPEPIDPDMVYDALMAVLRTEHPLRLDAIAWATQNNPEFPWAGEVEALLSGLPAYESLEPGSLQHPIHLVIVGMRLVASRRYMIAQSLLESEHIEASRPATSGSGSPMAGEVAGAPDLHQRGPNRGDCLGSSKSGHHEESVLTVPEDLPLPPSSGGRSFTPPLPPGLAGPGQVRVRQPCRNVAGDCVFLGQARASRQQHQPGMLCLCNISAQ
jgi:hypothetical protein